MDLDNIRRLCDCEDILCWYWIDSWENLIVKLIQVVSKDEVDKVNFWHALGSKIDLYQDPLNGDCYKRVLW